MRRARYTTTRERNQHKTKNIRLQGSVPALSIRSPSCSPAQAHTPPTSELCCGTFDSIHVQYVGIVVWCCGGGAARGKLQRNCAARVPQSYLYQGIKQCRDTCVCVIVRYPRASRKRIQLSWRCNALDGAPSDSLIQSMLLDPWSKCCVLLRSVLGRERARS